MKMHDRTASVQEAGRRLDSAIATISREYDLALLEVILLLSRKLCQMSRQAVGVSRHPANPEKTVDEA